LSTAHIFISTKNRTAKVADLVGDIGRQQDAGLYDLTVIDNESTDGDVKAAVAATTVPTKLITVCGIPFNKPLCLNIGVSHTDIADDDIVLFVDADMRLPTTYVARAREVVEPGVSWFPICFSLYRYKPMEAKRGNGWWRSSGRGNCAFLAADYNRVIGGWSVASGLTYGGNDDYVYWRAKRGGLELVRERLQGFFHTWHPNSRAWKSRYLLGKNDAEMPEPKCVTVNYFKSETVV